jgi:8-oxo-dGTP diphosphatase
MIRMRAKEVSESMETPHILAAGGIVVRHDPEPRIGIVQLRKNRAWVLPKGKLSGDESALAGARREVLEETGHDVSIHEFVGALSYQSRGLPKVVQFWRMQVVDGPARKLMRDVRSVEWLPLDEAVKRLTRPHERIFLENVGPEVLRAASARTRRPRPRVVRRKAGVRAVSGNKKNAAAKQGFVPEPGIEPAGISESPPKPLPIAATASPETSSKASAIKTPTARPLRRALGLLLEHSPLRKRR